MSECLFCMIAQGEIATETVWSDEEAVAFRDISPQAPDHVLVIPKRHYDSVVELSAEDPALAGRLVAAATAVAGELGRHGTGFRLVINTGEHGGQTVDHVHIHLLAGRHLSWPPG